jgi:hypothetical protein
MVKLKLFARAVGLHPLTALGLLVVDWMLFGEEVATGGVGWLVSLPVGIILGLIAFLIQRRSSNDEFAPAAAKGLLVGLLTAIPAPLSSFGILPLAAFGAIRILSRDSGAITQNDQDVVLDNEHRILAPSK